MPGHCLSAPGEQNQSGRASEPPRTGFVVRGSLSPTARPPLGIAQAGLAEQSLTAYSEEPARAMTDGCEALGTENCDPDPRFGPHVPMISATRQTPAIHFPSLTACRRCSCCMDVAWVGGCVSRPSPAQPWVVPAAGPAIGPSRGEVVPGKNCTWQKGNRGPNLTISTPAFPPCLASLPLLFFPAFLPTPSHSPITATTTTTTP